MEESTENDIRQVKDVIELKKSWWSSSANVTREMSLAYSQIGIFQVNFNGGYNP